MKENEEETCRLTDTRATNNKMLLRDEISRWQAANLFSYKIVVAIPVSIKGRTDTQKRVWVLPSHDLVFTLLEKHILVFKPGGSLLGLCVTVLTMGILSQKVYDKFYI